jgi:hypothetical protein
MKIVTREIMMYMLLLVGVQEVRWDKGGTEPVVIHFSMEMGMLIITWGQVFVHK